MKNIILLSLLIFASGCVSVKIGDSSPKKSTRYSYDAPGGSFYRIKDEAADIAWLSQKTSSTISIKSKCVKNNDIELEQWIEELVSSFRTGEILGIEKFKYNNRKALTAEVLTTLEGFENKLAITTFIKNSCHYILVLTASPQNYTQDEDKYSKLLQSFKAW